MSNVVRLRRNMPPEELGLEEALRLLFPGYDPAGEAKPKRLWEAGKQPRPDDDSDQIERLKQLDDVVGTASNVRDRGRRKGIKLLSIKELTARGISCPYFYARLGIAHAVSQAKRAEKDYIDRKLYRAKEQENLHGVVSKASESLNFLIQSYTPFDISNLTSTTGRFGHSIDPYLRNREYKRTAENYVDMAKTSKVLIEILHSIGNERDKYVKNGDPDLWVACFITAIGHLWTDLTGEAPTARGAFSKFLKVSYGAIGGDRDISGVRRIETSTNATPTENIFDKNRTLVPSRYLLLCEIESNKAIDPDHAEAIREAVEFEDENSEATITALCETGTLPAVVDALVRCLPWSSEALAASLLGIPIDEAKSALAGVKFD